MSSPSPFDAAHIKRRLTAVSQVLLFSFAAVALQAQTTAPAVPVKPAAVPPAAVPAAPATPAVAPVAAPAATSSSLPQVSTADLRYATRVALAQGVMFLKQLAEKDPQGWIVPPVQTVRVVNHKDVPRKYKIVEVQYPVYEYTDVVIFIPSASPSEPAKKVVRKQPTKQIGTRKVEVEQWDPNGPLEKIWSQPIYEFVGDTRWHFSNIGDSAMALGALRAAGVPESDPVIQRMVENLTGFLDAYGPPDQTWNLAWLTVAMAQTEGDIAAEWTQKLASRLLDGQITEGTARGLWGPMSIHPRLISILARDYLAAEAELKKRQTKLKEKPTKQNQALVDDAEADRNRMRRVSDSWTRMALRFGNAELAFLWDQQMGEKVTFPGATDFYYTQRSADMESTWVALHALSVAAETQRLPKESLRPSTKPLAGVARKAFETTTSKFDSTTVPPEASLAVLARAANALATLQPPDGRWNEANFHQAVTDFDAFTGVLPVPADPKSFPPLASPVTATSAAQGIAALDSIGRAVGMEKLTKFQKNYNSGATGRSAEEQALIKTLWPSPARRPVFTPPIYNLYLTAARPLSVGVSEDTLSGQMEDRLTQMLILAGNPAGGWGTGASRSFIPSSSRERHAALKDIPNRHWKGYDVTYSSPVELNKAHFYHLNVIPSAYNTSDAAPVSTAAAVYFLAGRLENPGAVLQELSADPALADLRKEADVLLMTIPKAPVAPPKAVAAAPAPAPVPVKKPAADELVPAIPIKPIDTKKKSDESF